MTKKILILSAHNDDSTIGCGATIKKFSKQVDEIHLLIFTDGYSARDPELQINFKISTEIYNGIDNVNEFPFLDRRKLTLKECELLGIKKFRCFNYPDNRMDSVPLLDIVRSIEKYMEDTNLVPDLVLTHNPWCLNIDHQQVSKATITTFRGLEKFSKTKIMAYETLTSSEWNPLSDFKPNCYVDVSNDYFEVEKAFELYSDEMREVPNPRNWETKLAKMRLNGSECGVMFAERFMILREVL